MVRAILYDFGGSGMQEISFPGSHYPDNKKKILKSKYKKTYIHTEYEKNQENSNPYNKVIEGHCSQPFIPFFLCSL